MIVLVLSCLAAGRAAPPQAAEAHNACLSCHENLAARLSSVVEEWKRSIHYTNGVSCHNCHGGDPEVRPDQFQTEQQYKTFSHQRHEAILFGPQSARDSFTARARGRAVSYFCGKCHDAIKEKHLGSPHGELGQPTCLYCHGQGSHAIGEASLEIIDPRPTTQGGRCAPCHREGTMEIVRSVKKTLTETEEALNTATEHYTYLNEQGYRNQELDRLFQHSKETRSHLKQTFHSFNMREITNFSSAIRKNAELTEQVFTIFGDLLRAKKSQALIGLGVMLFLLAFAGLLLYYRKAVLEH